ncbi:hypothetical protein EZV62_007828 [Acer yangbiense]|uniref:Ubiquitin-like protease family profile domain-containing protein n=1 Tax=Acer yangbiense TaxID=1000413 RepID=A0A5C7IAV3_9ROSI|nr:hypothetical protein EZV62_007828 [Acer yangbiense]
MDKSEQGGREEEEPWIQAAYYVSSASECKKKDANGNSKSRSEIGKTWNLLPIEEKAKFRQPDVVEVAARILTGEQPHLRDNDIPNNSDLPPTDEEIPATANHLGHEDQTINTRCTPSRWCRIVNKLLEEQKEVVRGLGFGNLLAVNCRRLRLKICRWLVDNFDTKACAIDIHGRRFVINSSVFARVLGISDKGDQISIYGDVPNFDYWKSKFSITSRGIFLKDIEHSLEEMTTADYEFKVTLCLYLLGTILSPSAIDYVQTGYLIPLGDVGSIAPSEGQYDAATHGETSHANQEPGTGNNMHMKGVHDVLQVVKEIQDTLKSELYDIRTKYIVFTCADGEQYSLKKSLSKLRESYMSNLRRCQQIYIPINDLRNHWYLAVFDLNKRDYQILDSNPPRRKDDLTRLNQVRKLMQSLDIVLSDDIVVAFPTTFSFTAFSISYAKAPTQPNGYDCGLFLCMFMDDNCPTPLQMKLFQYECQRLFWARFLALFPGNSNLLSLKKNAQEHYNKLLSTGEVVPTVKTRPAPMKKLRGKVAALMD